MNNVAQFIKIREQIESHASRISKLLEENDVAQPKLILDQAADLLAKLTVMVDNDIQEVAVGRLTRLLGSLRAKVATKEKKKRPAKKLRPQDTASHN
jgi:hypothetical protein